MDDLYRGERRHGDEDEDQEPVIGAAALGDRHNRQPRIGGLQRHARGQPGVFTTGARRRRWTGPGMIPMTRHRPVKMNMAASDQRSTSCAVAAMVVRGRPRKLTPTP